MDFVPKLNESSLAKVLVAAPEYLIRRGIVSLLQELVPIAQFLEAANGTTAVSLAFEQPHPNLCLLDSSLANVNCLEVIKTIKGAGFQTEFLILASSPAENVSHLLIAEGALGYILKTDSVEVFLRAVECVSRHECFLTESVASVLFKDIKREEPTQESLLTGREMQALKLLAKGFTNKEIAYNLNISVRTVETHRSSLMRKLDVHSITALLLYSHKNRMIDL